MGSSEYPWFAFDVTDWTDATAVMTDEQAGAYIRMLCWAWKNGGLPNDERAIRQLGRWSRPAWQRIWTVVGLKWELRGGRLVNPRQELERAETLRRSNAARENAEKRWLSGGNAGAHATAQRRPCSVQKEHTDPPPTPPQAEGRRTTRAERKAVLRAVGPASAFWRDRCVANGHPVECATPEACALLTAKAEHPDEVPA